MGRLGVSGLVLIAALAVPASAQAIIGLGYCTERATHSIKVERGDTLIGLAKRYFGDWKQFKNIAEHNGVENPNLIRVGQRLELPGMDYNRRRLVSVADMNVGGYCNLSDMPVREW